MVYNHIVERRNVMALKNDIVTALESNRGKAISGQELADMLGVSRAAVWKAVKALQNEGYSITAGTNKGYILEDKTDVLSQQGIKMFIEKKNMNNPVIVYKTIDSTNSEAKKLAMSGAEHGTIVAANEQTNGRGRRGNSFYSPAQTGIYMSVILKPQKALADCLMTTVAAAVAVTDSIEALTGKNPQIKWVNDIFLDGRKICGILTEAISDFESGMAEAIIVGVGVNVSTADFPEEIAEVAGSLSPENLTRNQLAAEIAARIVEYSESTDNSAIMAKYREKSMVIGRNITFTKNGIQQSGYVKDINDMGNLVVETAKGTEILASGEITIGSKNLCQK